jgi:hypothetical protein
MRLEKDIAAPKADPLVDSKNAAAVNGLKSRRDAPLSPQAVTPLTKCGEPVGQREQGKGKRQKPEKHIIGV